MVAIVSGQFLGLKANSENQTPLNGNAALGQGRESVFVNSSTGNVYIQGRDEYLSTIGLDLPITRIYNSLGNLKPVKLGSEQFSLIYEMVNIRKNFTLTRSLLGANSLNYAFAKVSTPATINAFAFGWNFWP